MFYTNTLRICSQFVSFTADELTFQCCHLHSVAIIPVLSVDV